MDDAEARAILREHGEDPPKKGRLSPDWRAMADGYRQDTPGPDYDPGITDADFTDVIEAGDPPEIVDGEIVDGEITAAAPVTAERRPRRPRASRPPLRERLRGKPAAKGKAKGKPRHPRVPVDRLIGRAWEIMGGLAARVDPPMGAVLTMQSPVAGLILEDVVKGTAADRVLQPLARAEERAEKVLALAAPPMIVAALEHAATLPEDQARLRQAILLPMLEESLVLWVRIAGDKVEEMARREVETGPAREKARELIAMIFPQPAPQPETVAA